MPVDLDDLADMLSCVVDGGIIISKSLNEPHHIERQVLAYRSFIRLLFSAPAGAAAAVVERAPAE